LPRAHKLLNMRYLIGINSNKKPHLYSEMGFKIVTYAFLLYKN